MRHVQVQTTKNEYPIIIHHNFDLLCEHLVKQGVQGKKVCLITDDNVSPLYLNHVVKLLQTITNEVSYIVIPHGEKNKNLDTIQTIYEGLLAHKLDRESVLIALGGGVTGDMVGFASATYMRGIDFIQIPTTLLAQVDSSIGGKTGVDFDGYKNVVGAFHQPRLVYINTQTLSTLPIREVQAGMAEIIKHSLIESATYFKYITSHPREILALESEILEELIYESCLIKSKVVSADEKEKGLRATLNFGHTIGHAVERLLNFSLLHGECVAIGMVAAAYLSKGLNQISAKDFMAIEACMEAFNLPTRLDNLDPEVVYQELYYDKKTKYNALNFIVLTSIGSCEMKHDLEKNVIIDAIKYIMQGDSQ
ncbi:3-dehydroquinate synthase [Vallitalea pronyensis]|uniref:3-dehydroquinate synthase n=1 Tax=Vallitalea pronyensis TaxID=1348613 RepID=A0A8J8SHE9_9FIRM|nr:3-dehydroquinate synthase [Vallitalea pronyensis]QUI23367.1 3-dehydroquinate synthase [Vallitalea pronyensis]